MSTDDIAGLIQLEARKFAATQQVSPFVIESMGVEAAASMFGQDLTFMLKAYLYGLNGQGTHTVRRQVPASWWQHFKQSAIDAGNPFFRRVKTRTETVTVTADLFSWWPDMDAPVPSRWGDPVRVVMFPKGEWQ